MAQIIPPIRAEQINHPSEQLVLEAFAKLPAAYVVMHSYPWLRPERDRQGGALREGEADFLILHPGRGLLIVEVKGGDCELRDRTWYRAGREIRDPFDQARRSKYALLDAVEERTRRTVHRGMFTHGEVVIFPHHAYEGALPLNADARTLIDARGLKDVEQRILGAYDAWGGRRGPPPELFQRLKSALLPSLRLVRVTAVDISAESARLVQLTLDQHAVLSGLLGSGRVLVEGVAGSGKTLLALEYAITLAEQGKRCLLLCYNRHLAEWLAERVGSEPRLQEAIGSVEVSHFHRYALGLARAARVEFVVPPGNAARFWEEDAALLLEQAIEVLRGTPEEPRFDAVIVDEGQDFARDWWVTVEELAGGRKGAVYVFLDRRQSLRAEGALPPLDLPTRLTLDINCRNTRSIAESGARVSKVTVRVLLGAPEGEPPSVRRPGSLSEAAKAVVAEIRGLLKQGIKPSQIAALGPASLEHGSLKRFTEIDGTPLTSDAAAWRRGEGLLVSTARAFKGLEADAVIVYDLASFGDLFTLTDLYVAWTRAQHRLILICQNGEVRAEAEAAIGAQTTHD